MSWRTQPTTRERAELLRAIGDEKVYRTFKGTIVRRQQGSRGFPTRCDRAVRLLMAEGLVDEPPEGMSFFTLTEAALPHLPGGAS